MLRFINDIFATAFLVVVAWFVTMVLAADVSNTITLWWVFGNSLLWVWVALWGTYLAYQRISVSVETVAAILTGAAVLCVSSARMIMETPAETLETMVTPVGVPALLALGVIIAHHAQECWQDIVAAYHAQHQ